MLGGLFGTSCTVELTIDGEANRKTGPLTRERGCERGFIFADGETVEGNASINMKPGKKVDHQGIKAELVGQVATVNGSKNETYDFFTIAKDLEPPGVMFESKTYSFKFGNVDKTHESYCGENAKLRYFVRLTVVRGRGQSVIKEQDFLVHNVVAAPEENPPLKMEVGIDELLHLEFEFSKSKFHMKDCVVGKVFFLLARIRIKHMELNLVRREITGNGTDALTDNETLTKFEVMDGTPVKDQCIPVRLYLTGFDLTPTYKCVQNKFSVKYFLNLVLVDCEDRRYFKQQEVTIFRQG